MELTPFLKGLGFSEAELLVFEGLSKEGGYWERARKFIESLPDRSEPSISVAQHNWAMVILSDLQETIKKARGG